MQLQRSKKYLKQLHITCKAYIQQKHVGEMRMCLQTSLERGAVEPVRTLRWNNRVEYPQHRNVVIKKALKELRARSVSLHLVQPVAHASLSMGRSHRRALVQQRGRPTSTRTIR